MINKTNLRKEILEKRKCFDIKKLSMAICDKIKAHDSYKNAKNVFAFYPMKYEVDIKTLFDDETKNFFIPRVDGEDLLFCRYKLDDVLVKSSFGVLEPQTCMQENDLIPDLIIVPAVAVDKDNYRLGYGKGFYDRFLSRTKYKNVITMTPIFSEFIVDSVFKEVHDKKVDIIVQE